MKKLFFLALLIPALSFGAARDWKVVQRAENNLSDTTYNVVHPATGSAVLVYDGSINLPVLATFGSNMSLSSGVIDAAPQVQTDWNATSGLGVLLNKPSFATVATTGAYADLSGSPSLAAVALSGSYSDLAGRPSLATVATSGAYADLTGRPSIPAAQVNSDWNASSGIAQILNKPALANVATSGAYSDLSGRPSLATVATTGSYNDLADKPTLTAGPANVLTIGTVTQGTAAATITGTAPAQVLNLVLPKGDTGAQGPKGDTGAAGTNATVKAYAETTQKSGVFPIFKSATVASGVAVFNLTADGTSGGSALCSEVLTDSVAVIVNDATASYQMSWVFSNGNKTLTVTSNKLTTANLVSGILGQAPANGAVVKLTVFCA